MKAGYFIGELPPPYGGVAVKDALVYHSVFRGKNIKMIDMVECRRGIRRTLKCCFQLMIALLDRKDIIVGLGKQSRRDFVFKAYRLFHGKRGLKRIHLMVMGGSFHKIVAERPYLQEIVRNLGTIWVEADIMKWELKKYGAQNVEYFPNCRTQDGEMKPRIDFAKETVKLVFYSRICREKGIESILDLKDFFISKRLNVDFYGDIAEKDRDYFLREVEDSGCFFYKGVFDAVNNNVYQMLNQYDVLLFPSKWHAEGVPGVLVEAKFAGITVIATDWNYNSEIVRDGTEGLIIKDGSGLQEAIERLTEDREFMNELKKNSSMSSRRYAIESYKEELLKALGL